MSEPGPPRNTSASGPPSRLSFSEPPLSVSAPSSPISRSSPTSPRSWSAPLSPSRMSAVAVVTSTRSSPSPARTEIWLTPAAGQLTPVGVTVQPPAPSPSVSGAPVSRTAIAPPDGATEITFVSPGFAEMVTVEPSLATLAAEAPDGTAASTASATSASSAPRRRERDRWGRGMAGHGRDSFPGDCLTARILSPGAPPVIGGHPNPAPRTWTPRGVVVCAASRWGPERGAAASEEAAAPLDNGGCGLGRGSLGRGLAAHAGLVAHAGQPAEPARQVPVGSRRAASSSPAAAPRGRWSRRSGPRPRARLPSA